MASRRGPAERVLARLLTGPAAFALAGTVDVLALAWLVARHAVGRRYHGRLDVP